MRYRPLIWLTIVAGALTLASGGVLAHGGGNLPQPERLSVPTWLFLSTGGGVVGASFLLASFVTDRSLLEYIHSRQRPIPASETVLRWIGRSIGLAGLVILLVTGLFGPRQPLQNAALLLVWGGWWAGYTITVYVAGNSWPAINPFRTLATPFDEARIEYPDRLNAWPSVIGLLVLVWLEVVSPITEGPRFLATVVGIYLALTLTGAYLFGNETWFSQVDPISNVFRLYGKIAPLQRTEDGIVLALPGSALVGDPAEDVSEVGLIIALVWGTTYDGFVQTPLWSTIATDVVRMGIPAWLLYPFVLGTGFVLFIAVYWLAARSARRLAPTCRAPIEIANLFAPSLLAIAAGYHLAHYLSFFLTLSPALVHSLLTPLQPASPPILTLPSWFGGFSITFLLLGHVLAIWIAHSIAYEQFPSRLQAIRSQYPITLVMVLYTMVSLWIVTRPISEPPYV